MRELDNIKTTDLAVILNKDAVLKRFYPLIPQCGRAIKKLCQLGIYDKYMFLDEMSSDPDGLEVKFEMDSETLKLLEGIFHLYDFKNCKLRDINSADSKLIETLIGHNIKTSKDYLLLCMSTTISDISEKYSSSEDEVLRLFNLCDLMRLPGVKDLRASLYYHCGYKKLSDFASENPYNMKQKISKIINEEKIDKAVPLGKELATQIAVAKVLPHIHMKNADLKVREASLEDYKAIVKICCEDLGYSCDADLVRNKISLLDKSRECVFVAECEDKVIGYVHVEKYDLLYFETMVNILGLAVCSESRRQGAGRLLMTAAEEWAKSMGAVGVRLNSGVTRIKAHEFYRVIGYVSKKQQLQFFKDL